MTHPRMLPLWPRIAALLDLFTRAFGGPAALMARRMLHRRDARDASRWLADSEATVRRLLFAAAATVKLRPVARRAAPPGFQTHPPQRPAPASTYNPLAYREAMLAAPTLGRIGASLAGRDDPAHWAVSFRLGAEGVRAARLPKEARAAAQLRAAVSARAAPTLVPVDRLARRLEAVRRVIADPDPWVRRLARKLRARPALAEPLKRPPLRHWRTPCGEALDDACAAAREHGQLQHDNRAPHQRE